MGPVAFAPDGSIPEVEMTSQGAGGPLSVFKPVPAARACLLCGTVVIGSDGGDREVLRKISPGSRVAYKYIDFGSGARRVTMRVRRGRKAGRIHLRLGKPWGPEAGRVDIPAGKSDPPGEESFTARLTSPAGFRRSTLCLRGKARSPARSSHSFSTTEERHSLSPAGPPY